MAGVKAQTVTEYALMLAAFIAALAVMQAYIGRSIQGRQKSYVDTLAAPQPFSPQYSRYEQITQTVSAIKRTIAPGGALNETDTAPRITRLISGDGTVTSTDQFFPDSAPQLQHMFEGVEVPLDHSIGNVGSVVDDFSDKELSKDALFGGQ